jgi:acetyl esterase
MAAHPVVARLLAAMQASPAPPLWSVPLEEARARTQQLAQVIGPGPEIALIRDLEIPVSGHRIPALLISPPAPDAAMLFLHGGGWVIGSFKDLDAVCRYLALAGNYAILVPDYRLAPEHPYPAALADSHASLSWLSEHCAELFGARLPLIVGGASARGNLAAALAQERRRDLNIKLAAQLLIYPVLDADFETPSYRRYAEDAFLDRKTMRWFWDQYVPNLELRAQPSVSPLRQPDLSGLPPAVIVAAERDPVCSEAEAYAAALESAGVPVASRTFAHVPHGFFTMVNQFDEAKLAISFAVKHLARFIGPDDSL